MKIEAKAYRYKTETHGKNVDLNTLCGSITFKAESEVDAVQLAALYNGWVHADTGRIRQLREEALTRYCKKNNVTVTITPNSEAA